MVRLIYGFFIEFAHNTSSNKHNEQSIFRLSMLLLMVRLLPLLPLLLISSAIGYSVLIGVRFSIQLNKRNVTTFILSMLVCTNQLLQFLTSSFSLRPSSYPPSFPSSSIWFCLISNVFVSVCRNEFVSICTCIVCCVNACEHAYGVWSMHYAHYYSMIIDHAHCHRFIYLDRKRWNALWYLYKQLEQQQKIRTEPIVNVSMVWFYSI